MKDQVDGLKANGIEACFINSSQTEDERQLYRKLKIKRY
jgi:ATP-dependent DNA helicase RecQ